MNTVNKMTTPEPSVLHRRIGSTVYKVGIHFKQDATETLNEKVGRLLIVGKPPAMPVVRKSF